MKYARVTPRKMRRVTNLMKGRRAGDALINLRLMPHSAAKTLSKVLKSAMANAEQKKVADPESMKISNILI